MKKKTIITCLVMLICISIPAFADIAVESIELSTNTLTMRKMQTMYLQHTILPDNATNKKVTYKTSDPTILWVSNQGELQAYGGIGQVDVIVTTEDGLYTDTCQVTVIEQERIDFTTSKAIGDTMIINATRYFENNQYEMIWIDINGNHLDDPNESFSQVDATKKFPIVSQTMSIYGSLQSLSIKMNDLTSIDVSQSVYLEQLDCSYNSLNTLDVSHNLELRGLNCDSTNLSTLDVSNNVALTSLGCCKNALTSLDISNNTVLKYLYCHTNQLTQLDVSNASYLEILSCANNGLLSIDVSNNSNLSVLACHYNQLSSLDLSHNSYLRQLICAQNKITSLDCSNKLYLEVLFGGNNLLTDISIDNTPSLTHLTVSNNALTTLDISPNNQLYQVVCNDNQLEELNIESDKLLYLSCENNKIDSLNISNLEGLRVLDCAHNNLWYLNLANGHNSEMIYHKLYTDQSCCAINAQQNPLTCIQIDAGFDPTSCDNLKNKWLKDSKASWSETPCSSQAPVSINPIRENSIEIWSEPKSICLSNLPIDSPILVSDITGKIVFNGCNNQSTISIAVEPGMYLISINQSNYKVIVSK